MPKAPPAAPVRSPRLRIFLLGAFRLERDPPNRAPRGSTRKHAERVHLPTRKTESLLAYLILHPEPHPREQLAALLWGDVSDDLARSSLRRALVLLRQVLGERIVLADRARIQLHPAFPLWVDAREFQAQAETALRSADAESGMDLDLYQDDLLIDFDDEWIAPLREHLRSLHLQVLLALAQSLRARAEYARAIDFAIRVLNRDAGNEFAHQIVMFCYAMQGKYGLALRQFERCQRALREALGIEPSPETLALAQWIKGQPAAEPSHAAPLTNLPAPLTSFIGREREIAELKLLLKATRMLTLTGAGGSGKTRLAIQVAAEVMRDDPTGRLYKDGVWWADLAGLREEALVAHAIAQTLGVREMPHRSLLEALTSFLKAKQLLLILDNCEHLLEACAQISETLLTHCPDLRVLATSRQSFNIAGETAWIVPSLALPSASFLARESADKQTIAALEDSEAVRFFIERAQSVKLDFQLTEQNAISVARICEWLDGIPLALELAAARIRLLTAEHLAERLHDRFNLLTTGSRTALPRHQTLRACFDWSYDLIPADARKVFRRLSVFMGSFALEAVEAVCSDAELPAHAVLDHLSRLVDRSLVNVEQQGGNKRYRLLETIREYGSEKLRESDEADSTRNRHLDWFLKLAAQAEPELRGAQQAEWLAHLEREHDNLRAALQWSGVEGGDPLQGMRLAGALVDFWELHGHFSEGRRWLEAFLKRNVGDRPARAKALQGAGILAYYHDVAAARHLLEASVAIFRELGDKRGLGYSLYRLGWLAIIQCDFTAGHSYLEESIAILRELGNRAGLAYALHIMGVIPQAQGHWAAARPLLEESLRILRELGDKNGVAITLQDLGIVIGELGDSVGARSLLEESLALGQEIGSQWDLARTNWALGWVARRERDNALARYSYVQSIKLVKAIGYDVGFAYALSGLGSVAALQGQSERAARLLGAAIHFNRKFAERLVPVEQAWYDSSLAIVRAGLGEEGLARAWAEGQAMTLEQAVEYALEGNM